MQTLYRFVGSKGELRPNGAWRGSSETRPKLPSNE
jgi:hypothetical protein